MSGILDLVTSAIGQGNVQQLSSQIGTDPSTTQRAISAALPSLFGGMAKHADTDTGAQQIHSAVTSTTPAPAAPEPNNQQPTASAGMLGQILGPHESDVQQNVAKSAGIDMHQAGKVLMYLAPIVIGVLARKHQDAPQSTQQPGALSSILHAAHQSARSSSGAGGMLGGLLGSVLGK